VNTSKRRPQGNNCVAIAAPPAASIAHLRMMATQRFGSNHLTAAKRNAPTKQIPKICTSACAADIKEAYHPHLRSIERRGSAFAHSEIRWTLISSAVGVVPRRERADRQPRVGSNHINCGPAGWQKPRRGCRPPRPDILAISCAAVRFWTAGSTGFRRPDNLTTTR
jgi:hypothetical protein